MSRTKKGKKPAGYDYWSKRPYSTHGYGPEVKKLTHKAERARSKQDLHKKTRKQQDEG